MKILYNENLAKYSSMRVGGNARIIYFPECIDDIISIVNREEDFYVFGKISNVLIPDSGIDKAIIMISENFSDIKVNNGVISANAGISMRKLSEFALVNELAGLENFHGIPGTLGGGIFMNAGAYGKEMKDVVIQVDVLRSGKIITLKNENLDFGVRKSIFQNTDDIILGADLKCEIGDFKSIEELIKDLDFRRKDKQPLNYPSCGSIFKRPKDNFASKLIDECGLKGKRIGGAEVSTKHAGFIINKSNATYKDVIDLINYIKYDVYSKTGVLLEEEVRILK